MNSFNASKLCRPPHYTDNTCPDDVHCRNKNCLDKCGHFEWFGNLSPCDVVIQTRGVDQTKWKNLTTLGAGEQWDLGHGSLYLPAQTRIRAVEKSTMKMIHDYGEMGKEGVPNMYVPWNACTIPDDNRECKQP